VKKNGVTTTLNHSQRRGRKVQVSVGDSEDMSESDTKEAKPPVIARRTRSSRTQGGAPKASGRPESSLDHIVLVNKEDCEIFTTLVQLAGGVPHQNRILEIQLEAGKSDELFDFHLALALHSLHPRNDGTNTHRLRAIKIMVKGTILYTRYSYHLASPAWSEYASERLNQLATGGLSEQDRSSLAYKITSTEKSVANALLGIRGLKYVLIEGAGKMEGEFAQVLRDTLTQRPGTPIARPAGDDPVPLSTLQLYGEGSAVSRPYYLKEKRAERENGRVFKPYATSNLTQEHDFSSLPAKQRYLINEKTQLLGHFLGMTDAEARELGASDVPKGRGRRGMREVVVDDGSSRGHTKGPRAVVSAPKAQRRDWREEWGMERMVRIRESKRKIVESCQLTDPESVVELGWKVR
jgi:hypothetical protein